VADGTALAKAFAEANKPKGGIAPTEHKRLTINIESELHWQLRMTHSQNAQQQQRALNHCCKST
jgi:hypothetical protein